MVDLVDYRNFENPVTGLFLIFRPQPPVLSFHQNLSLRVFLICSYFAIGPESQPKIALKKLLFFVKSQPQCSYKIALIKKKSVKRDLREILKTATFQAASPLTQSIFIQLT